MTQHALPAIIEASPAKGRLGLPGKCGHPIQGKPQLACTVERLLAAAAVSEVWIVTPSREHAAVKALLQGLPVQYFQSDKPDLPGRDRIRRGRKWALGAWRGGLGHSTFAGEAGSPEKLLALCNKKGFDHILLAPAEAPLLAPALVDRLVGQFFQDAHKKQVYLATCPPGLGADVISRDLLAVFADAGKGLEAVLDFRPDAPDHNVDGMGLFHWYPNAITGLHVRLCGDTDRSLARLESIAERFGPKWQSLTAQDLINALKEDPRLLAGDHPQELVVDITTRQPGDGPIDGPVRPDTDMPPDVFAELLAEINTFDDIRLTLGCRGDPLLHPAFGDFLDCIGAQRPFGVHIHTHGLGLDDAMLARLAHADPDIISISLDAAEIETYRKLHNHDGLAEAEQAVDRLLDVIGPAGSFVIPEFALCDGNRSEVASFYQRWFGKTGWVSVADHDDLAGQRPSLTTRRHLPPQRDFCVHLAESLAVGPDGDFLLCMQDMTGETRLGAAGKDAIQTVWEKRPLTCRLCENCHAWAC